MQNLRRTRKTTALNLLVRGPVYNGTVVNTDLVHAVQFGHKIIKMYENYHFDIVFSLSDTVNDLW